MMPVSTSFYFSAAVLAPQHASARQPSLIVKLRKVVRGSVDEATALMKPAAEDVLNKWPVSKRVNSSRTSDEDETLIIRLNKAVQIAG